MGSRLVGRYASDKCGVIWIGRGKFYEILRIFGLFSPGTCDWFYSAWLMTLAF
jgi:hypothetical protein